MFRKTWTAAALAVTIAIGAPPPMAAAVSPAMQLKPATATDTITVEFRERRYERRHWHHHRRHYRRGPVIRVFPPPVVRSGISRHVRWCANRYRSYNARTNTYMGFDGRPHRCRSPF